MRVMRSYGVLFLGFVALLSATQTTFSQTLVNSDCPAISVSCPDSNTGPILNFSANKSGGDAAKLTFNWTVSSGIIISGQGTALMFVDITGFEGKGVTATVEVGGLPDNCGKKASCSLIPGSRPPIARKFDQYGDLSWAEERARLDKFAGHLEPRIRLTRVLHHGRSSQRGKLHRSNKRRLLR